MVTPDDFICVVMQNMASEVYNKTLSVYIFRPYDPDKLQFSDAIPPFDVAQSLLSEDISPPCWQVVNRALAPYITITMTFYPETTRTDLTMNRRRPRRRGKPDEANLADDAA